MQLYDLSNVILEPTRISILSESALDPIILSGSIEAIESGTVEIPSELSDHYGTYTVLKMCNPLPGKYTRNIWSYKNGDYDSLNHELSITDWQSMLNLDDISSCVLKFNNYLTNLCTKFIPQKKVIIRPDDRPWFNSQIRHEIRNTNQRSTT